MTLRCEHLQLARAGRPVGRPLSLSLPAGAALRLRGRNGAGKSTLLRTLAGLLPFASGSVTWHDAPARGPEFLSRLCFLPHGNAQTPDLAVREHAHLEAGIPPARLEDLLTRSHLTGRADQKIRTLSAGQQRRLALIRIIHTARPLWLLDEPDTSLDTAGRHWLEQEIERHLAGGGSVLMATHDPALMESAPILELG